MKAPDPIARRYVLYFNESLRGLSVGAPVTFLGLPAGEVTDVGLAFDAATASHPPARDDHVLPRAPASRVRAGKERCRRSRAALKGDEKRRSAFLRRLVDERGLRAQLRSGSLLTGQLYVAFDYFPKRAEGEGRLGQRRTRVAGGPEQPRRPRGEADEHPRQDRQAAARGDRQRLKKDLESLDADADGREQAHHATSTPSSCPRSRPTSKTLQRTLVSVERAMNNADATLLGPNAPAQQELRDALQEFTRAARSLRVLTDYLERQPSSLIRGKTETRAEEDDAPSPSFAHRCAPSLRSRRAADRRRRRASTR